MRRAIRPVHHDEHLTIVEHLDELRSRIIVAGGFIAVAFAVCFWQHNRLLNLLAQPLHRELSKQIAKGNGTQGEIQRAYNVVRALGKEFEGFLSKAAAPGSGLSPSFRSAIPGIAAHVQHNLSHLPLHVVVQPTTLGVGEPFTITITVCFWGALLFSLPFLLYQVYSYILPAFSPNERDVVLPVMLVVPFLFAGGVLFGFEIVLPAAVHFLQGFDSGSFNELVQANSYYSFSALVMFAMGLIFQVPLFVVALARSGIVSTRQLRKNRRYAIVVAALVGAALPGDAITMILETAPIIVLYEVGILVSRLLERRDRRQERARERDAAAGSPPPPPTSPIAS